MRDLYTQKNQRVLMVGKGFLALLLLYLLFHLFLSERSIPSMMSLSAQEQEMTMRLASLETDRQKLMDRVTRLRPETLDPDLVEEYSIQMLGHGVGNETIVIN